MNPPGSFYTSFSKPTHSLKEAKEFARNFSLYINSKKEKYQNAPIFKIHPGVATFALTDHASGQFYFNATTDELEREDRRQFGPLAATSQVFGKSYPALASGPNIGHQQSRDFTLAIIHSRAREMESSWFNVWNIYINSAEFGNHQVLSMLNQLSCAFMFKWIFDFEVKNWNEFQLDVEWLRLNAVRDIHCDSPISQATFNTFFKQRFTKKDKCHLNRLLTIVRNSKLYPKYKCLAKEHNVSLQSLENMLLFTFGAAGFALAVVLHPAICRLAANPKAVGDIINEIGDQALKLTTLYNETEFPVLDSIVHELLRLAPAPLFFFKKAMKDLKIPTNNGDEYHIPKGSLVMASLPNIHCDETIFHEATVFKQNRFLDNPELKSELFIFGIGHEAKNPYGCAGRFANALTLFKLMLSTILTQCDWSLDQEPIFVKRYFASVGPIDIKFATFNKTDSMKIDTSKRWVHCDELRKRNENCMFGAKSIHDNFAIATKLVSTQEVIFSTDDYMKLYGLYKQAREGDAPKPAPSRLTPGKYRKWCAWNQLQSQTSDSCKTEYITMVASKLRCTRDKYCCCASNDSDSSTVASSEQESHTLSVHISARTNEPWDTPTSSELYGTIVIEQERIDQPYYPDDKSTVVQLLVQLYTSSNEHKPVRSFTIHQESESQWIVTGGTYSGEFKCLGDSEALSGISVCLVNQNDSNCRAWINRIRIQLPQLLKEYTFPVHSWVTASESVFIASTNDNPSLVKLESTVSQAALNQSKANWKWKPWDGNLPQTSAFENIDDFPDTFAHRQLDSNVGLIQWFEIASENENVDSGDKPKSLLEYAQIPKQVGIMPNILKTPDLWQSDIAFTDLFLAGTNPKFIKKCNESSLPPKFLNFAKKSMGDASLLSNAFSQGRMFVADYRDEFNTKNSVHKPNADKHSPFWLPAPICLMYVPESGTSLTPIAIQLDEDIFVSPESENKYAWMFGKMAIRCADIHNHQLKNHLLYTHQMIEVFIVAMHRQLPEAHPIFRLLRPHFTETCMVNKLARKYIIGPNSVTSNTMSVSPEEQIDIIKHNWNNSNVLDALILKRDLNTRGVANKKELPCYPYRDDGLLVWEAIHRYVKNIIQTVYASKDVLDNDESLHQWIDEIANVGFQGKSDFPAELSSTTELIDILTGIIYVASVSHATMNFNMYEVYAFPPFSPSRLVGSCPNQTDLNNFTEEDILSYLPSNFTSMRLVRSALALSKQHPSEIKLGFGALMEDVGFPHFVSTFQSELEMVEKAIQHNNNERDCKYDVIIPSKLPTNISL